MMGRKERGQLNQRKRFNGHSGETGNNQGFSLIEVIVCLAILAIFCIPLFRGFNYAAANNFAAHHSQSVTAYAQQVLEAVKSMRIEDDNPTEVEKQLLALLKDTPVDPALAPDVSSTYYATIPSEKTEYENYSGQDDFPEYEDNLAYNRLFTVISYRQQNVSVGGKTYTMEVELNPLPYSVKKDDPINDNRANDINVTPVHGISDMSGGKFPVITAEMVHQYDKSNQILGMIQTEAKAKYAKDIALDDIYKNLEKEVILYIADAERYDDKQEDSDGIKRERIRVYCDVKYHYKDPADNRYNLQKAFTVYDGIFALDCGEECRKAGHDATAFSGWEGGGKIYISAQPYSNPGSSEPIMKNTFDIVCSGSSFVHADKGLDVYLIRGYYPRNNYHFNKISGYYEESMLPVPNLTGEAKLLGMINFYTNIKGKITNPELSFDVTGISEDEKSVGSARPHLRSYDVTVTLTEQGETSPAAQFTAAKRIM